MKDTVTVIKFTTSGSTLKDGKVQLSWYAKMVNLFLCDMVAHITVYIPVSS